MQLVFAQHRSDQRGYARHAVRHAVGLFAGLAVVGLTHFAGAAQIGYRTQVTARNPIVYLQLDETSGTTAADSSPAGGGNGTHPGTFGAGVTLGAPSAGGSVPTFGLNTGVLNSNGTGTAPAPVTVPASAAFDLGTGDFAVELWFNTSNVSTREDLFTLKGGGSDLGIQLSANGAGKLTYYHNASLTTPATLVTANAWHLATASRSAGTTTLYLDGVSIGTAADASTISTGGVGPILVGTNNPALPVTGTLDEFAFYGSALTGAQVLSDYTSGIPEPASFGLLLTGGIALLARRRAK